MDAFSRIYVSKSRVLYYKQWNIFYINGMEKLVQKKKKKLILDKDRSQCIFCVVFFSRIFGIWSIYTGKPKSPITVVHRGNGIIITSTTTDWRDGGLTCWRQITNGTYENGSQHGCWCEGGSGLRDWDHERRGRHARFFTVPIGIRLTRVKTQTNDVRCRS